MFKLFKAIALLTIIFGLLYAGVYYYFANYDSKSAPTMVDTLSVVIDDMRDAVASAEQRIQDRSRESLPYDDEERVLDSLKKGIDSLRTLVKINSDIKPADTKTMYLEKIEAFVMQKSSGKIVLFGALLLILLLLLLLLSFGKVKKKQKKEPAPEVKSRLQPQVRREDTKTVQSEVPVITKDSLEATLEKFRSAAPLTLREEPKVSVEPPPPPPLPPDQTVQQASAPEIKVDEPVVRPSEPIRFVPPSKVPPQQHVASSLEQPKSGANLIETVFELSKRGYSVEEIAGEAHIDQDQVRLILRFRQ
ncbi:MAG: hypothetical protein JNL74_08470 [Fibrobacteres bacterium]|nr:hypothetical protein [Fibrobacterota bacterium]